MAHCLNAMGALVHGAARPPSSCAASNLSTAQPISPSLTGLRPARSAAQPQPQAGNILLRNARPEQMRALLFKLQESGTTVSEFPGGLRIRGKAKWPMEIRTLSYPGFPTDMQAPMMVVACVTPGTSVFLETIFENRFMHVPELIRMGASIRVEDRVAVIEGGYRLQGADVRCPDLRSGAALLLAGLTADGITRVEDGAGHIDRGYVRLEETLSALGAKVRRL